MLNILVVDDDRNERDGIKFLLSMLKLNISIYERPNGELALEFLQEHDTDILITDIKMPFMDGISLGEKARKLNADLKIVILSAYGDFDYARRAISFDAHEYLLKPVDSNTFNQTILRLVQECLAQKEKRNLSKKIEEQYTKVLRHAKEKVLMDLISTKHISMHLLQSVESTELKLCAPSTRLLLLDAGDAHFENTDSLQKILENLSHEKVYFLQLNENQCLIFNNCETDDALSEDIEVIKRQLEANGCERFFIIVSEAVTQLCELYRAYQTLESIWEYMFFKGESCILTADNFRQELVDDTTEKLLRNIYSELSKQDLDYAFSQAFSLIELFKLSNKCSAIYFKYHLCEIIKKLIEKADINDLTLCSKYISKVFSCTDIYVVSDILQELKEKISLVKNNCEQVMDSRIVITSIKEIIEKEYMRDISLTDLADRVYLTPSYLSYLFKKETGHSFIQYLTQFRLQKSKELLCTTNIRVVEIGSMVGYSNPSYFSLLFKNYFGVSPAKYRETNGMSRLP